MLRGEKKSDEPFSSEMVVPGTCYEDGSFYKFGCIVYMQ